MFPASVQAISLADFRDLLALISSPFFLTSNNVEGVKILMFDRYHGIGPFVSSWSHLTLPDALYHARIDPKILRCTLQTTPPLIKP